jgi:acetyl esterase/lipase
MNAWRAAFARRLGADPPVGEIAVPAGAHVERDLAYGAHPAQRIDLYRPERPPSRPLIALVGGGAWAVGDKSAASTVGDKVAHWLPLGHPVASIGYRRLPDAGPFEQAGDVARALAFLQRQRAVEGRSPRDLVVVAHSSGAHLVALLGADLAAAAGEGVEPWRVSVLVDSAALDVVDLMRGPHLPLHARAFGAAEPGWREASPLHRLRGAPPPMLLVHSSRRPLAGEQARAFAAAVVAHGGRADVLALDLSHAELNGALGSDREYTARVDAFLERFAADGDDVALAARAAPPA